MGESPQEGANPVEHSIHGLEVRERDVATCSRDPQRRGQLARRASSAAKRVSAIGRCPGTRSPVRSGDRTPIERCTDLVGFSLQFDQSLQNANLFLRCGEPSLKVCDPPISVGFSHDTKPVFGSKSAPLSAVVRRRRHNLQFGYGWWLRQKDSLVSTGFVHTTQATDCLKSPWHRGAHPTLPPPSTPPRHAL